MKKIRLTKGYGKNHNMTNTRFYRIWAAMCRRCKNKRCLEYKKYGAVGIDVWDSWLDFRKFKDDLYSSYLEHVDKYGEKDTTIDRINNKKGYFLENVKWSTRKEQRYNQECNKKYIYNGEKKTIQEWADKFNIGHATLWHRLVVAKWKVHDALNIVPKIGGKYEKLYHS